MIHECRTSVCGWNTLHSKSDPITFYKRWRGQCDDVPILYHTFCSWTFCTSSVISVSIYHVWGCFLSRCDPEINPAHGQAFYNYMYMCVVYDIVHIVRGQDYIGERKMGPQFNPNMYEDSRYRVGPQHIMSMSCPRYLWWILVKQISFELQKWFWFYSRVCFPCD